MTNEPNLRLMFLASKKFESEKAIRGAFLLADWNTKPIEFRCTNPIRPNALQAMLYGDTLEQHIMVELNGIPLFGSLKERPHIILVREQAFLGIRPKVDALVIQIAKEEEVAISSTTDDNQNQLLHSSSARFEPIVLRPHNKFPEDRDQAKKMLAEVFDSYNLLEPFHRISTALDQVHAQKIGERK